MLYSYLLTIKTKFTSYNLTNENLIGIKNKERQTTSRSRTSYGAHIIKYLQLPYNKYRQLTRKIIT